MTVRLERPADRQREDIVAGVLAREMGITLRRPTDDWAWFDFVGGSDPQHFIEMKCRTTTQYDYRTIILAHDKAVRLMELSRAQPVWTVPLFAAAFREGTVRWIGMEYLAQLPVRPFSRTKPRASGLTAARDTEHVVHVPIAGMIWGGEMTAEEMARYNALG